MLPLTLAIPELLFFAMLLALLLPDGVGFFALILSMLLLMSSFDEARSGTVAVGLWVVILRPSPLPLRAPRVSCRRRAVALVPILRWSWTSPTISIWTKSASTSGSAARSVRPVSGTSPARLRLSETSLSLSFGLLLLGLLSLGGLISEEGDFLCDLAAALLR